MNRPFYAAITSAICFIMLFCISCKENEDLEVFVPRNPFDIDLSESLEDWMNPIFPTYEEIPSLPTDMPEEKDIEKLLVQFAPTDFDFINESYIGYVDLGLSVDWCVENMGGIGLTQIDNYKSFKDFFNPDDYAEGLVWHDAQYYYEDPKESFQKEIDMLNTKDVYPAIISYDAYIEWIKKMGNINLDKIKKAYLSAYNNAVEKADASHRAAVRVYNQALDAYNQAINDYNDYIMVNKYGFLYQRYSYYNWTKKSDAFYDYVSNEWKGFWRTPTKEEFEELISKCTWEKINPPFPKHLDVNYESGYIVTGPSGKSIFISALTGGNSSQAMYMSSTVAREWNWSTYVYSLDPGKGIIDRYYLGDAFRIRPVRTK